MDERKRYQIFISSTYLDLKEERDIVMQTILNYDCFPIGQEMFPAMVEDSFEYIKRIIDDSDYYLLIIGGCYGALDYDGLGWIEKEYDYAVLKGVPVLVFDHHDFTKLPINKIDQDEYKKEKLIAFKEKVATGRLIAKWSNADNLALAVATSLKRVLELQPRTGWVRANTVVSGDVQKEIERLKKEIAVRRAEVDKLKASKQTLESRYQSALQVIEKCKGQIRSLEAELERYKISKPTSARISQPQTEVITMGIVSFKMVHVEGGTFMMGANEGDKNAYPDEKPAHGVTLSDYWIGETQVTQALWVEVMGENPSKFKGNPNLPVESVSWEDCMVFIRKLNKLTGLEFHLPTEAQWEFAAREGNIGKDKRYLYAGSYDAFHIAWFEDNSGKKPHPVGQLAPNELGLYDMSGNVWEWCNDWYDNNYSEYSNSTTVNPIGPELGTHKVVRGGSWGDNAAGCRVSCRLINRPTFKGSNLGLRLAL
ncbi:MAG: SUMF1/EgtB/PvdO family nonheme iron enzyme [Muribaculaceae bacterium]|nr:SUMF1/EgtB/PvdO family nonheme iron enzyme [Muribaculaceae bacterium]